MDRLQLVSILQQLAGGETVAPELASRALKEASSLLQAEPGLFHAIVQNCPDMIFLKEAEGLRFVLFNAAGEKLLGIQTEELQGKSDDDFFPPEEAAFFVGKDREVLSKGEMVEIPEETIHTRNGMRLLHTKKIPILDASGRPQYLLGISRDITAAKEAEHAVAASEQRLAEVLEVAKVVVWETDNHGHFTYVRGRTEEMLGWSAEELLGMSLATAFPGVDLEHTHRFSGLEVQVSHRMGLSVWASVSGFPRFDAQSHFVGYRGSALDITEAKIRQLELADTARQAEKANRAKSIFLATMSHEIRTPLNGVVGMTGLLQATQLTEEQLDYVGTIQRCSDSLMSVINDILDYSKIEAGGIELEENCFDPRVVIEEAIELIAPAAESKGLEVLPNLPANEQMCIGDATRLRQIVVNLLSNAVKFTPSGEVEVGLRWEEQRLHGWVRDTGIGIPEDRRGRLFKPFSQVDASTTRQYGGTGLGLAICRRLVELMDGDLTVESEPGQGSTFRFRLRLKTAELATRITQLPSVRALVVVKNPRLRELLANTLEAWGMVVQPCPNWGGDCEAEAAVVIYEAEQGSPPRALDGAKKLALAHRRQQLKLDHVLYKPIRPSVLRHAIVSLLAPEQASRSQSGTSGWLDPESSVSVLLAEDNDVNQKVARLMLRQLGYSCDVVANGLEVLHACEMKPYDIVLMDVQMPEMDGLQAAGELRERNDAAPYIIALTAGASVEERDRAILAGMQDFLPKPVRIEQLRAALDKAVGTLAAQRQV